MSHSKQTYILKLLTALSKYIKEYFKHKHKFLVKSLRSRQTLVATQRTPRGWKCNQTAQSLLDLTRNTLGRMMGPSAKLKQLLPVLKQNSGISDWLLV